MFTRTPSNKRKRSPFRQQILIAGITLSAVAVAILLDGVAYRKTREMVTDQFNRQQLILARSAASGIETLQEELSNALSSLVKQPCVQQMTPECLQSMQAAYWGYPQRTSMRMLDRNGVLCFIYPFDGWRGELIGKGYSREPFFQEARETGRNAVSGRIMNEHGEARIRMAVPVYQTHKKQRVTFGDRAGVILLPTESNKDTESDKLQGVMVGSFDPQTIAQRFVAPIISGKTGYAWLLNEEGVFLAHHEVEFIGKNAFGVRGEKNPELSYEVIHGIQRRMISGEEGVGRYVSGWHRQRKGEIEKLVAFAPVHIGGKVWSVAVCAPVSEVEEIIRTSRRSNLYALGFVMLTMIAGAFVLFIISYRWSHSLEQEVVRRTSELSESEERYRTLVETMTDIVFSLDVNGKLTYLNPETERITGRTNLDLIGHHFTEILAPEFMESTVDHFRKWLSGEKTPIYTVDLLHMAGGRVPVELNTTTLFDAHGKTLGMIGVARDISRRRRAEEALRENEARLKAILRASPIGIGLIIDRKMNWANDTMYRMTGYRDGSLSEKSVSVLFPNDEEFYRVCRELNAGIMESGTAQVETRWKREDGSILDCVIRACSLSTSVFSEGQIVAVTDITRRKRLEVQLQQAQKMKALGTLAGGIAHDFNNILGAIIGCTELALMDIPEETEAHHFLCQSLDACNRATELVKQILAFSRQRNLEQSPVQLSTILKEALKMLRASLPSTIEIRQDIEPGSGMVLADPTQMHQVLMNLCTNAAHAMREQGGILEVSLCDVGLGSEEAARNPDFGGVPHVKLTVRDTGHGMDRATLERIFDPYFTTKAPGEGTGLGLAVVHGIVSGHGGTVRVHSEPGRGTTFQVFMLRVEKPKDPEDTGDLTELPMGKERILFIDDEKVLVGVGQEMLERLGYEVVARTSSIEALKDFRSHPFRFDLVITDMTMPNMTGAELAGELMRIRSDIPIILCTGFSEGISEEIAGELGVRAFVMKPLLLQNLAEIIRKVLDSSGQEPGTGGEV